MMDRDRDGLKAGGRVRTGPSHAGRGEAEMRVRAVGADALLLEVDDPAGWFAELWRRRELGELVVQDIVPGARTVLLDGVADPSGVAAAVRTWRPDPSATASGPLVEIAAVFDGPDLPDVARFWRIQPDEVVDRLARTEFHVAFCGFAPGFAYLAGLPDELAVPRLETPRAKVPAGSVGLADRYAGVYPTNSPGGWRLVGRTEASLFDHTRAQPALLAPGTRVRFVPIESPVVESTVDASDLSSVESVP
jgi:KipI family sensor histidine kinase inhibitor